MATVVAMCDEKSDRLADRECSMIAAVAPILSEAFALEIVVVVVVECDSYRPQL